MMAFGKTELPSLSLAIKNLDGDEPLASLRTASLIRRRLAERREVPLRPVGHEGSSTG